MSPLKGSVEAFRGGGVSVPGVCVCVHLKPGLGLFLEFRRAWGSGFRGGGFGASG